MAEIKAVDTIRIRDWRELEDALFFDSTWDKLNRLRTKHVFRGLSASSYPLETTLQRLVGQRQMELEHRERLLLRQFQKYACRYVSERETEWHWLSIAQHHRVPTRLLDWTNSPLVALHFATVNYARHNEEAVVWAVNFLELYETLPAPLHDELGRVGAKVFAASELAKVVKNLERLRKLSKKPFMVFLEPPSLDDRIVNQWALHSLMSHVETVPGTWLEESRPITRRKILIPARLKPEIRDRLDMMNITERVLFPGLDGLGDWLRRYYNTRP